MRRLEQSRVPEAPPGRRLERADHPAGEPTVVEGPLAAKPAGRGVRDGAVDRRQDFPERVQVVEAFRGGPAPGSGAPVELGVRQSRDELSGVSSDRVELAKVLFQLLVHDRSAPPSPFPLPGPRSEEHTSELQSQSNLVCRLLLEKKKKNQPNHYESVSVPPNQNYHLLNYANLVRD